jgi:hypothetical protein
MMQHLSPGISAPTKQIKNARGAPPRGFMKFACVGRPGKAVLAFFHRPTTRPRNKMRSACMLHDAAEGALENKRPVCSTTRVPVDGVNVKVLTFYKSTMCRFFTQIKPWEILGNNYVSSFDGILKE